MDGQGHGGDVFSASAKNAVKDIVETSCWVESYPQLQAVATHVGDLYDPAFASAIKMAAALNSPCEGNTLCETWMARYASARPHITGAAAQVPILIAYAMNDSVITSGRMACAIERLVLHDGANVSACIDPDAEHTAILFQLGDYVNSWIAWKTLGGPDPGACPQDLSTFVNPDGTMAIACEIPPIND
jgi:hypothetical protein